MNRKWVIYLTEMLLFYVRVVLIARASYTYLQMVEVLNLVVFLVLLGLNLWLLVSFFKLALFVQIRLFVSSEYC